MAAKKLPGQQLADALRGGVQPTSAEFGAQLFRYARPSKLRDTFPTAARDYLQPSTLAPVVSLTHPAISPGEVAEQFRTFEFVGGAGVADVTLSPTPRDRIQYYLGLSVLHNDPVARRVQVRMQDAGTGLSWVIRDTLNDADYPAGTVVTLAQVPIRGPILVPPNHFLAALFVGLAAGQTGTIRATTCVAPLADTPPPLF